MKWQTILWSGGALAGLLLAACAPLPVRKPGTAQQLAAQVAREQTLGAQRNWSLDGRFAASDGRHGGSGSLAGRQHVQH